MLNAMPIVTNVTALEEVKTLNKGTLVGDLVGGRSFTDNIAEALERRSFGGWCDVTHGELRWTLIMIEC